MMKKSLLILCVAILCVSAGSANADMWLSLDDGTTTVSITDGGAADLNPAAGAITFVGDVGPFISNVTTGLSKPLIGTANVANLHLDSVHVTGAAGTLTITLSDTDYDLTHKTPPTTSMLSEWSATTDGTVDFTQILDPDNTNLVVAADPTPGNNVSLASGALGPGSVSGSLYGSVPISSIFSLTEIAVVTHGGAPDVTSFDLESTVPVPGAVLLGLLGLTAAGIKLRRFA